MVESICPSLSVLKTIPRFAAKPPTTWCRTRRGALGRGRQRLSSRGLQRTLHHSAVTPSFGRTRESRSRFLLASRCLVK
ncbi:hypothetical protein QBC45DRAFT_400788 [Copromyces sp. CBS 386.78]|nr:hypothetical protein QBC45DRAFT_400788 [Copromyces sp. CBS 386.78]